MNLYTFMWIYVYSTEMDFLQWSFHAVIRSFPTVELEVSIRSQWFQILALYTVSVLIEIDFYSEWISKSMLFTSCRKLFSLFFFLSVLSFIACPFTAFVKKKSVCKIYSVNQNVFIHFIPVKNSLVSVINTN